MTIQKFNVKPMFEMVFCFFVVFLSVKEDE